MTAIVPEVSPETHITSRVSFSPAKAVALYADYVAIGMYFHKADGQWNAMALSPSQRGEALFTVHDTENAARRTILSRWGLNRSEGK